MSKLKMSKPIHENPYSSSLIKLSELKGFINKELGLTEWIDITQENINTFAKITQDEQWIHVDVEKSKKESPYKNTIAHGFYILSLASRIAYDTYTIEEVTMGVNYGLNKVRFISAVPAGSKIRGRLSLLEYKEIENGAQYVMKIVFELKDHDKPACVTEFIAQAYTS